MPLTSPSIRPAFLVHRNGSNQTGIATTSFVKIQFTTKTFDTNSDFDNVTNFRFTPRIPGKYQFGLMVFFSQLTNCRVSGTINLNASEAALGLFGPINGTADSGAPVHALLNMNGSTDYVEFFAYHEHGSNRDILGPASRTFAWGQWVSQP